MSKCNVYEHDLGNGLALRAFSLSPEIDRTGLAEIVGSLDGKANNDFRALAAVIVETGHVDSIRNLKMIPQDGEYRVPEPLRLYREAIQREWDSKGKFNGPVLIATSKIEIPLEVIQGGYYDYAATRLGEEPARLLPAAYPPGKTVEDILNENRISLEQRARYFGFAHLMWPSEGQEFLLVQRAKGMGIAANCVSTPGSTPDIVLKKPGLKRAGFGIEDYWSYHFAEEMLDEFRLQWGDFWTGDIRLFDDKRSIPFGAVNIFTNLSVEQISKNAYNDARVLKEHSILYSMSPEAIRVFLQRFPVFPSVARVMDIISKERE